MGAPHTLSIMPDVLGGMPFSFRYDGASSADLLPAWSMSDAREETGPNRTRHVRKWMEPQSGFSVELDALFYSGYCAVDYVLWFTAGGAQSALLESILPLDIELALGLGE